MLYGFPLDDGLKRRQGQPLQRTRSCRVRGGRWFYQHAWRYQQLPLDEGPLCVVILGRVIASRGAAATISALDSGRRSRFPGAGSARITQRVRNLAGMGLLLSSKMVTPNPAATAQSTAWNNVPPTPAPQQERLDPSSAETAAQHPGEMTQPAVAPDFSAIPVDRATVLSRSDALSTNIPTENPSETAPTVTGQPLADLNVDNGSVLVKTPQEEESPAARAARQMARAGLFRLPSGSKHD